MQRIYYIHIQETNIKLYVSENPTRPCDSHIVSNDDYGYLRAHTPKCIDYKYKLIVI